MHHAGFAIAVLSLAATAACAPTWHEYRSPHGDFTVQLPGDPIPVDTIIVGATSTRHIRGVRSALHESPSRFLFYVTSHERPRATSSPPAPRQALDAARDDTVGDLQATFISETPLAAFGGGREVVIKIAPDVRLVEHIFVRNDRVYKIGAAEKEGESRKHTDRFLNSFRFKEPST